MKESPPSLCALTFLSLKVGFLLLLIEQHLSACWVLLGAPCLY